MKLISFRQNGETVLGYCEGDSVTNLTALGAPATLDEVLQKGPNALADLKALHESTTNRLALSDIKEWLSPISNPGKVFCVGLNYVDHAAEGAFEVPTYPVLFTRYPSSWVAHNEAIIQPSVSKALDYEGEMAVIIGKPGRHITKEDALSHVAGYSIFNEGSVRDFQMRTHQWTIGKNFDKSGSFGPCFVSSDSLPAGASGLRLQTRLNGKVMQDANTKDMVFDVQTLITTCSEAFSLSAGDVILSGTPSGVGAAHKPPIFMKPGDVCEIEIENIGILSNPIEAETVS